MNNIKNYKQSAFTIVELLVVIVIIGILAAITIVSYTGISQKATVASLTSDLTNASKQLKLFQVENNNYPATIDCMQADSATNKCIKTSTSTTYTYKTSPTNSSIFCIEAIKSNQSYNITQENQLLAGPCPVLNLDAGNTLSYPGTGTTWKDLSGNDNNGTLTNGVAYSSVNGGAMSFDGVDDYIAIPTIYSGNASWTMSAWIKTSNSKEMSLLSNASGGPVQNLLGISNSKTLYRHYDGTWKYEYGDSVVANSNWHYLTWANNSNQAIDLYVDGVKDLSAAPSSTSGTSPLDRLGGAWSASLSWNGLIGGTRFYNRTLSTSEIIQNFNTQKARYGL